MIDGIIKWSLDNRFVVVVAAVVLMVWGAIEANRMPVEVLPNLTAPTVTVVVEAHGMAPEEIEKQVTFPIETTLNGAPGVRRVRSTTGIGYAVINADFEWGKNLYRARQIVSERLQQVRGSLPPDIEPPTLAPMTSVMGEIMFVALTAEKGADVSPRALRTEADWTVKRRLQSVTGVSNVVPIGGETKQFQVVVDPEKLASYDLALDEVSHALENSNQNTSAGFYQENGREYLIYGIGRLQGTEDIARVRLGTRDGTTVTVGDIGTVKVGNALKRGDGSYNGRDAVVIGIQKQPNANTLALTERVDEKLGRIEESLPEGMTIQRDLFRQADFIEVAVDNVVEALRDGAILVVLIILLFLGNWRATVIAATAIPLALVAAVLVLKATGGSINTMTLGGMAIAVGAIVDDAIIDVENVVRRLREFHHDETDDRSVLQVVFAASSEIRSAIVYATSIIVLVFLPLFFLQGIEGRILQPLGVAYIVSLCASLAVALTVTPALCLYLLPGTSGVVDDERGKVTSWLESTYAPILDWSIVHWKTVVGAAVAASAVAVFAFMQAGQSFLPTFNEGSLTVAAVTQPGTSLATSDKLAEQVEKVLLEQPEVTSTARRTGRAKGNEHAQGVYSSEIDVSLEMKDRSKAEMLADLREELNQVPGMNITIGQPLSHRIDHMLSGTRANVAVKIFGDDLTRLRSLARQVRGAMQGVDGVVDLNISKILDVPFLKVEFDRRAIAEHGLDVGEVAETVETAFRGHTVTRIADGQRAFDVLVRYEESAESDVEAIRQTLIATPGGARVPLHQLAEIRRSRAPNRIVRENGERKLVVSCNVSGGDLVGVVEEIRRRVDQRVDFPDGYHVEYGGQFESATRASRRIGIAALIVLFAVLALLVMPLESLRDAMLVMANLPLALIGGVAGVWATGGIVSISSMIGFVMLFGIATRNGLLMVTRIRQLFHDEGVTRVAEAVRIGARERLTPILMTAISAGLGLVPLALKIGEPGGEIQGPMAVVILCGLVSSTFLNMVVVPALYNRFGALNDVTS
ncbi:MAG: efflux RND transporter permease subunit [Bradymonadaceae bacterium]